MFKNILLEHLKSYEDDQLAEKCDCDDDDDDEDEGKKKNPFAKKDDDKSSKDNEDNDDDDDEDVKESIEIRLTEEEEGMTFEEAFDAQFGSDDINEDFEAIFEAASFDKLTIGGKVIRPDANAKAALEALFTEASVADAKTLMNELTKDKASYDRIVRYAKAVLSDD